MCNGVFMEITPIMYMNLSIRYFFLNVVKPKPNSLSPKVSRNRNRKLAFF